MPYDWTAPTSADLAREAVEDEIVTNDIAEAEKLRAILQTARAEIRKLDFRLGCPAVGYDMSDILTVLEDMQPPATDVLQRQLERLAQDLETV